MKAELPESCCKWARDWVAGGGDPNERLEFYRGEVLALAGPAWAFAKLTIRENEERGPEFVRYRPFPGRSTMARIDPGTAQTGPTLVR